MTMEPIKWVGVSGLVLLSLAACADSSSTPTSVADVNPEVTQDNFEADIEVRDGSLNRTYDAGDNSIQVNSVDILDDDVVDYFSYQAVHVNATIENNTDDAQEFDLWAQLRVGSISDRDNFGALQLSAYGLDDYDVPELNDDLFIELDAGESVTYDFLFDVIVPEEDDNDIHVIYQINPMNQYEDGYITWDIDGFTDLEPSEVEEIDWDAIEDDSEIIDGPEDVEEDSDEYAEDPEADEDVDDSEDVEEDDSEDVEEDPEDDVEEDIEEVEDDDDFGNFAPANAEDDGDEE